MPSLTKEISQAWEDRDGPAVLATVSPDGKPNAAYVDAVSKYNDERLIIADNNFNKTRANISFGTKGALLFVTSEGKPYQIRGALSRHTSGPIYEDMKSWNSENESGEAAVALIVEEAFSGARKLV